MGKRIKILVLVVIVAALLYLGVALYFGLFPFEKIDAVPVEPFISFKHNEQNLFELKYYPCSDVQVFDLSVSRDGADIFFGTDRKSVVLTDNRGDLKWERDLESDPLQTKISACGQYLAIGTSSGSLFLLKENQEVIRESDFESPITHLSLSSSGEWLVSGSKNNDNSDLLTYYNHRTGQEWDMETETILCLTASPDDREIYYTEKGEDSCSTVVLDLQGKELWRIDGSELRALSPAGNFSAMQDEIGNIVACNNLMEEIWRKKWGTDPVEVFINPAGDRMLVFDKQSSRKSNLYFLNAQGKLIWKNLVDADARVVFSPDGRGIIYCAGVPENRGNKTKEGFSRMVVVNEKGEPSREIDLPINVERVVASPCGNVFVIGNDSGMYQVNLFGRE
ncbi:MAG: hypothetical protein GX887_03780 [Firmicutes bacterium]|nr:hypothetical protein [Bacillota bacterium]